MLDEYRVFWRSLDAPSAGCSKGTSSRCLIDIRSWLHLPRSSGCGGGGWLSLLDCGLWQQSVEEKLRAQLAELEHFKREAEKAQESPANTAAEAVREMATKAVQDAPSTDDEERRRREEERHARVAEQAARAAARLAASQTWKRQPVAGPVGGG